MIDWNKPLRTKDGRRAIYDDEQIGDDRLIVIVEDPKYGYLPWEYSTAGLFATQEDNPDCGYHLENFDG